MTNQLTLPACVLPGCPNCVGAVGEPCGDCLRAFGPMLRHSAAPPMTADQITERDSYVHRAYARATHDPRALLMGTFTYTPLTELGCSTCGGPSIGCISWPDGTFVAWCADHADAPQQTSLMEGA